MMWARVFCSVVVLPEPGELIMLSTKTFLSAKTVRIRSAMMSLASSTRRTTLISRVPDLRRLHVMTMVVIMGTVLFMVVMIASGDAIGEKPHS